MYVRNVAGYNFAFKYRDTVIYIPCNGQIYSIPDDSGSYRELKVIPAMHIRTQHVTYINKNGNTASDNLIGHKRRGRPTKPEVDPNQPLKGVRVKYQPETNIKEKPVDIQTKEDTSDNNSIIDIDLGSDQIEIKNNKSNVNDESDNVKIEDIPSTKNNKKSKRGKSRNKAK